MKKRGNDSNKGVSDSPNLKKLDEDSSFRILKLALKELKGKQVSGFVKKVEEDSSFQILKFALRELKEKYNLNLEDLKILLREKPSKVTLPVSIFYNKKLSALEIICKYLKEELDLSFSQIASLLSRDQRTVWVTYHNAVKKQKSKLSIKESFIGIPLEIFSDRKFSVLELLVSYLKEHYKLSFSQISSLLQKDSRNVWTVYSRFKKKKR